ncbi:hypothetical protein EJP82_26325 [Paenibacillus anaericanus]|uniref:Uncharacterized protein n=1 Tax=Paenibacillus anaericanus TaxID=170367 RepID=A0A433XX54_9BACL|nr:hypothetical protein [Paenibacillus anaericanus]RUT39334.1 hypothetical protein EJP82_26325 [Paenibacillus anaericanus]
MRKKISLMVILILILSGIIYLGYKLTETVWVSKEFANHLYQYPLPPETIVLEKGQFNAKNWIDGGGSGGYWNVVSFMRISSELSSTEILKYYKDTELFPYPKSDELGVELEIYFEDDQQKEEYNEGFYYRSKQENIRFISSYFNDLGEIKNEGLTDETNENTNYIIQIHSGFSYFLQID